MTDDTKQATQLAEPFPPEQLKRHPHKGLTYVPIPEVVARLNRVLGSGSWGTEILQFLTHGEQETLTGIYPKWIVASVKLTGVVDDVPFSYDGVGGQEVQFRNGSPSPGPVDIGDNYKGAVSDATKKAAQALGVGLELAREDDAILYDQALREATEPKAPAATLDSIKERVGALGDEVKQEFTAMWAALTGDGKRGKTFSSGQVTVREADIALEWLDKKAAEVAEESTPANA